MKKIIKSTAIIVAVAAVVVGVTMSFFSDEETSTGNTFTAGAIDLKVDSESHYNGNECVNDQWTGTAPYPVPGSSCATTWGQDGNGIDITNEKFFDFVDLKPGDEGENTISLHVDNNDAWMCAEIEITSDEDITCVDPEIADEGAGVCEDDAIIDFDGEIGETLSLAWWADDGDNIYQTDESLFFQSGLKLDDLLDFVGLDNKSLYLTLADSDSNFFDELHADGEPLNGAQTYYVGVAWCFGDMDVDGSTGEITCDGAPVNNESQTDSLTADLTFSVYQSRNADTFNCEDTYNPAP